MSLTKRLEPAKGSMRMQGKVTLVALAVVMVLFYAGSVLASSESHEEHGAKPKGWVATDTYRVMNFAVLAVGLFLLLRKPVANVLNDRIKGIKEQLAELEQKKNEAEKDLAQYNQRLVDLEGEADKIVARYIEQGNEAKARILKEAEKTAVKLEEQAKRNIASEFERAKQNLQEETIKKAMAKAEELIERNITTKDQETLIDEYLDKVVA
jgi:F-type H+-transporting ATPase subunit b